MVLRKFGRWWFTSVLKKCYDNLNDDGIIIVKENLYNIEEDEEDNEKDNNDKGNEKNEIKKEDNKNNYEYKYSDADYFKQRPDVFYINLFLESKVKIKSHFLNPNWPENMMPLFIYVLSKNKI